MVSLHCILDSKTSNAERLCTGVGGAGAARGQRRGRGGQQRAARGPAEGGIDRQRAAGDGGDICEEDKKTNEESLDERNPRRVMSVSKLSGERVLWIITELNREATTVLMPDEY